MYAVSEGRIKINDHMIETYERAVLEKDTALHVVAGTSGYRGSNRREAGGRTYLKIECFCGDMYFNPIRDDDGRVIGIEIFNTEEAILFYDFSRRKFKKLLEGDEELPFIALFRKRKIIIRSEFEEYMKKNPEIMEDLKNGKRIS